MRVDLPEPEEPIMATNSPCSMLSDTERRAWTSTSPIMYVLLRSRTSMMLATTAASPAGTAPFAPVSAGSRRGGWPGGGGGPRPCRGRFCNEGPLPGLEVRPLMIHREREVCRHAWLELPGSVINGDDRVISNDV